MSTIEQTKKKEDHQNFTLSEFLKNTGSSSLPSNIEIPISKNLDEANQRIARLSAILLILIDYLPSCPMGTKRHLRNVITEGRYKGDTYGF